MKFPRTLKLKFPSSITMSCRFGATSAQRLNCRSLNGRQTDESDEQLENTKPSIHESLESDSNVIVERDSQSPKQNSQIFSTDEGIQMAARDEQ
jgi:hypothetical protein